MELVEKINSIIEEYFNENAEVNCLAVKNIMPAMIKGGAFNKDTRKGLPLRKVLNSLLKEDKLSEIPMAYAHKTENSLAWYIRRPDTKCDLFDEEAVPTKKQIALEKHKASDEFYVLELCDTILKQISKRQHRFSFLVGDLHKEKHIRTMLPLDAFYEKSSLVVEYDPQFIPKEGDEDAERKTNSGVSRSEQRKIYDERKTEVLNKREIDVLRISYSAFDTDDDGKIIRNEEEDTQIIYAMLKELQKVR